VAGGNIRKKIISTGSEAGLLLLLSGALVSVVALSGCASLMEPDFVKEDRRLAVEFRKENPLADGNTKFNERNIHYVKVGSAGKPKVIFIHGSPGDWTAWSRQMRDTGLYSKSLLIAADRLGYGGSDPSKSERSLDSQAQAMMKLLDVDDSNQPVILVGHSYGGPVVARMAMMGDSRVKGIVILAGSVDPALEPEHWYQGPADWAIIRWMVPDMLVHCNQEILSLKGELTRILPLWNQITAKTIVIQGGKDDLVMPGNADFIEHKLAEIHPEIIRVSELNHFIPSGRPDLIHEAIEKQLKGL
jgi:pimeloyl-ACP methyl ester carboxylesterase